MDDDAGDAKHKHRHPGGADNPFAEIPRLDVQAVVEGVEKPRAGERLLVGQERTGRTVEIAVDQLL